MNDLIDKNLPSAQSYRVLREDFDLKNTLFLVFEPKNGNWGESEWQDYHQWRGDKVEKETYINSYFSLENVLRPDVRPGEILYWRVIPRDSGNFTGLKGSPWETFLTDKAQRSMTVQVELRDPPSPNKFGTFWPKAVAELLKSLEGLKSLDVYKAGSSFFTYYAVEGVNHNMKNNLFFLSVLILSFKLIFGTWTSGLLLLVTFIWTGVCIHGSMALFGFSMEILSSGLFTMIMIASLEDYLFICHELSQGKSIDQSLERLFWPGLLTSFTTVLGFGSLMFTDVDILQRFGLWASIGAMAEWVSMFFFLPSMVKILRLKKIVTKENVSAKWQRASQKLNALTPSRTVAKLLLLTYILSAFFLPQLKISDSPLSLFPEDHEVVKDAKRFKAAHGWESDASLVFPLETPAETQKIILEKVGNLSNVAGIDSLFEVEDYLLSFDDQDYGKAILLDLERHPIYKRYRGHYLSTRANLLLKSIDLDTMKITIEEVKSICRKDCELVGETISFIEFMNTIPKALMESLALSLLLVGLFIGGLAYFNGFPRPVLFTIASLWGASTLIILMLIFNIKLNFLSCIFVSMMVGLTGDNAIQFIFAEKREGRGLGITYFQGCSLQVGIIMAFSCCFFLFSYFAPPRDFALVLALGFLLSLFGDIWLTKSLTES